jgi:hypothetical protein
MKSKMPKIKIVVEVESIEQARKVTEAISNAFLEPRCEEPKPPVQAPVDAFTEVDTVPPLPDGTMPVAPVPRRKPQGSGKGRTAPPRTGAIARAEAIWVRLLKERPDGVLIKEVEAEGVTSGSAWQAGMNLLETSGGKYEYYKQADRRGKPRGLRCVHTVSKKED